MYTRNSRQPCPDCKNSNLMLFVFPAPQADPCVELHIGRYQYCVICGKQFDMETGEGISIERTILGLLVNDKLYRDGMRQFMYEDGPCKPPEEKMSKRLR